MWLGSLSVLQIVLAVICITHAVKRNNNNWIYIILFFPIVGCLAYLIAEVMPDWRRSARIENAGDLLINAIRPSRKIEKLKEELAFTDSINNRQRLAQEYMNSGLYAEAIPLYESCLEGVYAEDQLMTIDLARALLMNANFPAAREKLLTITKTDPKLKRMEAHLLLARTYEALNEMEAARQEYQKLLPLSPGEEVRCRYAMLQKKLGNSTAANEIFLEIIANSKRNPRYYQRLQHEWIAIAKAKLTEAE